MAKDFVRTRGYVKRYMLTKANIQALSHKITILQSQNAMVQAMKGAAKAMEIVNRQVNWCYNIFYFITCI
jgi:charged multivesicular body protein 2A